MLDEVESSKCFIIPKHTLGSNQLQIQPRTVSLYMFASACLIIQIHEVNHKTNLDLSFNSWLQVLDICGHTKFSLKVQFEFQIALRWISCHGRIHSHTRCEYSWIIFLCYHHYSDTTASTRCLVQNFKLICYSQRVNVKSQ